jgi:hypothetical protein
MGARGPTEHPMREYLLSQIEAGELIPREAAMIAAVSRQRVDQWCAAAKIDPKQCRRDHLKALWAKEMRKAKMKARGVKPKRQSKAQMRVVADKAKATWDHRRRRDQGA